VNFNVDAYPNRIFHGTVAQVRNSPVTVQNVVTYDTVVSVNNDDLKLKPGMTANLNVVIAQRNDVLKIPNAALRFRPQDSTEKPAGATPMPGAQSTPRPHEMHNGTHTIYIMSAGGAKPSPVQVRLGISDGIYTEVTDGLHEGDVVAESILGNTPGGGGGGGGGFGMRRPF